jgi:glycosyltransferase involved in cell wall biosynthesis
MAVTRRRVDLLVMDPVGSGHHGAYVARILTSVVERGGTAAFLASDELLENPEIQAVRALYGDLVEVVPVRIPRSPEGGFGTATALRSNFAWWFRLRAWYRAASCHFVIRQVFLPYVDYCAFAAALLGPPWGSTSWQGIAMRTHYFHGAAGSLMANAVSFLKRAALIRLAHNPSLVALHLIDRVAVRAIERTSMPPRSVTFLADPASCSRVERSSARADLGVDDDKFCILLYGAVSLRKGLATLLTAISSGSVDEKAVVILAGKADLEAADILARYKELEAAGRIVRIDRYVDTKLEHRLFSAADCIWLAYQGHLGMSGVLVQAGRNGKPVIASTAGLIGQYASEYGLGLLISPENADAAVAAINRLIHSPSLCYSLGENGRSAFLAHSEENFRKQVAAGVFLAEERHH